MLNHKLLSILSLFDDKTFKKCHKFLLSPYFNDGYNSENIVKLYEHIQKYKARANAKELQSEFVFQLLYPAPTDHDKKGLEKQGNLDANQITTPYYTEYDINLPEKHENPDPKPTKISGYSRLNDLMTDLLKLVRQFLAQEQINKQQDEEKEFDGLLAEAHFFSKHGIKDAFDLSIDRASKNLRKQKIKGSAWLYRKYLLEQTIHIFKSIFYDAKDDTNLLKTHKYLDTFYATLKMELACKLSLLGNDVKLDIEKGNQKNIQEAKILTEALLPVIQTHTLTSPMLSFLVKVYEMVNSEFLQKDIEILENILTENKKTIPHEDIVEMSAFIRVFWTRLYKKKRNEQNLIKVFEKFEEHLKNKYLYRHDKLLQTTLTALVNLGLKLKKDEWVENFLAKHPAEKIWNLDEPNGLYDLNQSNLYIHQNQYTKIILPNNNLRNVFFDAVYRILVIKLYYENDSPLLDNAINNFRNRIAERMPITHKPTFNNFLNFLQKILNLKGLYGEKLKIEQLIKAIEEEENVAEKLWLIEKAKELL